MRIPDPKANTTTEAYLAYKAGFLEESELKPKLYKPDLHFDGWLAYWAGLTTTYPVKNVGKNLFDANYYENATYTTGTYEYVKTNFAAGETYTFTAQLKPGKTAISGLYVYISTASNPNSAPESQRMAAIYNGSTTAAAKTSSIPSGATLYFQFFPTTTDIKQLFDTYEFQLEYGSSATPYEPYSGEPEMLCDEEALVAYLSGVTNTYPEEIKDPYDVRIVGYLKHLVSARWPEPDYPVNNEEFYLSTMKPPVVPSGDTPSSDIEMDDTAEAPFIDLKMYGDTSQQTYTGKNLFNVYGVGGTSGGDNLVSYTAENEELTVTQVGTNGNGYVWVRLDKDKFLGKELTLSVGEVTSYDGSTGPRIRLTDQSGANIQDVSFTILPDREPTKTFSVPSELPSGVTELRLYIYVNNSNVAGQVGATSKYTKLQIEVGSTPTTYEPYVGGVPAPNPDYPQPVNVVTGRQIVGVRGKNLFHLPDTGTRNGVTFTKNPDGTFDLFGVPSANTNFSIVIDEKLESGEYTLSRNTGNFNIAVQDYSSSGWLSQLLTLNNASSSTGSINPVGTRTGFVVQAKSGVSYDLKNIQIQLEKGSSDTDFVPYAKENYEINLGKNLFNGILEEGIINGNTGQDAPNPDYVRCKDYIPVEELTNYVISSTNTDIGQFMIYEYKADHSYNLSVNRVVQKGSWWQTKEGTKYIRFRPGIQSSDTSMKFQIELGTVATEYSPYFEPIELCKIGDYQDYIYCDRGGDWFIHKEIGKMVFDNNTNWSKHSTTNGNVFLLSSTGLVGYGYGTGNKAPALMDTDICIALGSQPDSTYGVFGVMVSQQLRLFRGEYDAEYTAEKLKSEMVGHYIYGALVTPTDTEITDSLLLSQLNALFDGGSYEGKTYIKVTATDPNLPGLLYVEAGKYD